MDTVAISKRWTDRIQRAGHRPLRHKEPSIFAGQAIIAMHSKCEACGWQMAWPGANFETVDIPECTGEKRDG